MNFNQQIQSIRQRWMSGEIDDVTYQELLKRVKSVSDQYSKPMSSASMLTGSTFSPPDWAASWRSQLSKAQSSMTGSTLKG